MSFKNQLSINIHSASTKAVFFLFIGLFVPVFFFYRPVFCAISLGIILLFLNIRYSPDELKLDGLFGLVMLATVLNVISLPYETMVNGGELAIAYLRYAMLDFKYFSFDIQFQPVAFAALKIVRLLLAPFFDIKFIDFVLPAILVRVFLGITTGLLVFLIQRRLTSGDKNSAALGLITAFFLSSHIYTWLYMNGDQFRNAFGSLFMLAALYNLMMIKEKGWLAVAATLITAFCSILSHRVYLFIFLIMPFSMFLYYSLERARRTKFLRSSALLGSPETRLNFLELMFYIAINMTAFILGYYIVISFTPWSGELLFTGHSMDISQFSKMTYLERLRVPGIQFSLIMFIIIIFSYRLMSPLGKYASEHKLLLMFYLSVFTLSHFWMYSTVSIDLARLFIIVYPIVVILFVLQAYSVLIRLRFSSRNALLSILGLSIFISSVFAGKVLWETSSSGKLPVSFLEVFARQLIDLPYYIFGDGPLAIEQGVFLLTGIFFVFVLLAGLKILFNRYKLSPWWAITVSLLFVGTPGMVSVVYGLHRWSKDYEAEYAAAVNGDSAAMINLAELILRRRMCADPEVLAWYRKAAEAGNVLAQARVGYILSSIDDNRICGIKKNDEQAVMWLEKAAGKGNLDAIYMLGRHFLTGRGIKASDGRGVELVAKAANEGQTMAQFQLGEYFCQGAPGYIEQDPEKAKEWYCAASEGGLIAADWYCKNTANHCR